MENWSLRDSHRKQVIDLGGRSLYISIVGPTGIGKSHSYRGYIGLTDEDLNGCILRTHLVVPYEYLIQEGELYWLPSLNSKMARRWEAQCSAHAAMGLDEPLETS